MVKTMLALSLLISSALSLNAYAEASKADSVRIQISNSGMKPWDSLDDGEARKIFNTAVHSQALFINNSFDIRPGYIKSWSWDQKHSKYIFQIDSSFTYHDGRKISAYDFEFVLIKPFITTLVVTNDKTPLSFIKGIDKLKPGMKFKSGIAEGIRVTGPDKIEVYVPTGHARFLYSLGALLPPMAPIDSFKDDYYSFKSPPIGSGPYKVVYSDKNTSLVRIEKVSESGRGPKQIEFFTDKTAFENSADIALGGGIAKMRKYMDDHPGTYKRLQTRNPDSIEILTFNNQAAAARSLMFRKAVALAIDNTKEVKGFTSQTFTDQIIPDLSYGYQKPRPQYNLEEAKRIWSQLPDSIKKVEHVLVCHGTPSSSPGLYYQFIYDSLKSLGMNVVLRLGEGPFFKEGDKTTTMAVFGRYIDIDPILSFAFYLPGSSSEALNSDAEYVRLFKKAEAATSKGEKADLISKMSNMLREKSVVVPLHQRYGVYYVSSRVQNAGLNEDSQTFDVTKIEVIR